MKFLLPSVIVLGLSIGSVLHLSKKEALPQATAQATATLPKFKDGEPLPHDLSSN
jgi:hypothetical protein